MILTRTVSRYPRIVGPRQVPNYPIERISDHPLAIGMAAAYMPGVRYGAFLGIAPALTDHTPAGSIVNTPLGQAYRHATTSQGISSPPIGLPAQMQIQSGTINWGGQITAFPGAGVSLGLFTTGYDNIGSSPYICYGLYIDGTTNFLIADANYGSAFNIVTSTGALSAGFQTLASTFTSGTAALYVNGGVVGSTGSIGSGSLTYTSTSDVQVFDARAGDMACTHVYLYNYVLPAALLAWLHAEPFVMWRPLVRRLYYFSAAAPASTAQPFLVSW